VSEPVPRVIEPADGRERVVGPADRSTGAPNVALVAFGSADSTAWYASALATVARVHLIVPAEAADYVEPDLDPRVRVLPFEQPRMRRPLRQARMCRDLLLRVRSVDPDVLHVQQGHTVFNFALSRLRRYPLVVTAHDVMAWRRPRQDHRRTPQWPYTRGMRRADHVVIHGEALRSLVVRRGVDPFRIHLLPRAAPALARDAGEPDDDGSTILFFGRIWPYKGLEQLIRAEPLVSPQVPDLKVVIAGRGEGLARYRRLMRHPARFEVHNYFVSREERDELFRRASVVVLPYVDAATSAVIPLAYLHRKPVVVTSVGGLPEAVEDGRTGLIVPPRDHVALADALLRLLRDDHLRRELGTAGRGKLEAENAPDLVARRAMDVYALARASSRTAAASPSG
jgi:glycosyltransferase involved in cell wall biosynthesis